jgi:hypothetical protein
MYLIPSLPTTLALAAGVCLIACRPAEPVAAAPTPPVARNTAQPAAAAPVGAPLPRDSFPWLTGDSTSRTVTLDLEVTGAGGHPSARINGYRAGEARVIVPLGWTVRWNWRSADSTAPHSLVVMVQREKIPLEGGRASFSNAMTRMATEGLMPGQADQTTFIAEEAGWFWMLCGVPSHAIDGEWLELRVDPEARAASVKLKAKA